MLYDIIESNNVDRNEKYRLQNYYDNYDEKRNIIKVEYIKHKLFGRLITRNCTLSYRFKENAILNILKEKWVFIKISNMNAEILTQLCIMNDIQCGSLIRYCSNYNEVIEETMTEYNVSEINAQNLYYRIMNGGFFKYWAHSNNIIKNQSQFIKYFTSEIQKIGNNIKQLNGDKINESCRQNSIGSIIMLIINEFASRIIESMLSYLKGECLIRDNIAMLFSNGIKILKDDYEISLLNRLNDNVLRNLGFDLKFYIEE
jgi:hypothetical protein